MSDNELKIGKAIYHLNNFVSLKNSEITGVLKRMETCADELKRLQTYLEKLEHERDTMAKVAKDLDDLSST